MSSLYDIKYRPRYRWLARCPILNVVWNTMLAFWVDLVRFVDCDFIFCNPSGWGLNWIALYRDIHRHSFHIGEFYARRAKRILPALFGVVAFCYVAAYLLLPPSDLRRFSWSALSAITSSSNFYFWRSSGYFFPDSQQSPLLMTWSLDIEEQFYELFHCSCF